MAKLTDKLSGNLLVWVYFYTLWLYRRNFSSELRIQIIKKKRKKRKDARSQAGMSGSVYGTQLMTIYAVSLNGHRKRRTFMGFSEKLEGGKKNAPRWSL